MITPSISMRFESAISLPSSIVGWFNRGSVYPIAYMRLELILLYVNSETKMVELAELF